MELEQGKYLLELKNRIVSHFNSSNWDEIGLLTGYDDYINSHPRLLRSLSWGDEDYSGNVLDVLREISQKDKNKLSFIESYLNENFPDETQFISAKPSQRKITFTPNVFKFPT